MATPATLDAPSILNALTIARRYVINVGEVTHCNLTMVGCGGTGSFLALHLARLAWHARETHRVEFDLVFVDPDVIEPKNIGRQNFVPAEIGKRKAEALASRYSRAFGLSIRFHNEELTTNMVPNTGRRDGCLDLIVGCVDNTDARRDIHHVAADWRAIWWLDCGNHDDSGQVVLGNRADLKAPEISPLGFCVGLPLPSVIHPELVAKPKKRLGRRRTRASCADDALAGIQSLMVNQAVAGWAATYVYRLAVARDLDTSATYFDLKAGSARSEAITG